MLDLGERAVDGNVRVLEHLRDDVALGLVGRGRAKLTKAAEPERVELDPQLLPELANGCVAGILTCLGLTAREHERVGAALSHVEDLALGIAYDNRADPDGFGYVVGQSTISSYSGCFFSHADT